MAQEPPKSNNVEGTTKATASTRAPRKDVDLFPVGEKQALPAVSPQTGGNVARLGTQISIFNPVTFEEALEIVSCSFSAARSPGARSADGRSVDAVLDSGASGFRYRSAVLNIFG